MANLWRGFSFCLSEEHLLGMFTDTSLHAWEKRGSQHSLVCVLNAQSKILPLQLLYTLMPSLLKIQPYNGKGFIVA